MKVAVVAGTPVDTQMGVDYLNRINPEIETVFLSMGSCPRETYTFQMSDYDTKIRRTEERFLPFIEQGIDAFYVYCNSLGATVDYDAIAAKYNIRIITTRSAYIKLAELYNSVGLIAANNHTTEWIESIFTSVNPNCYVCGTGFLKLVEAVETKMDPFELVSKYRLADLCRVYETAGCQAVALGCTHFPYFKKELQSVTNLPVFDPADIMYEELMA